MIRVVLDTNVIVSAVPSPRGLERRIVRLAVNREIQLYVSAAVIHEYERVLKKPKFNLRGFVIATWMKRFAWSAHVVEPMRTLTECADPDDKLSGMRRCRGR